ncbi:MAG TPA: translesion DNA synthesis-associated protein ImuA [Burkholderiaceae bacterium]|nr:translesion DNA synthesis-associated protein ImuA [Burkholderiaceae bacterium]
MRAITDLLSLLHAGGAPMWRADERPADEACGPTLPSGFAALDRELPGGGWPQGQLIELLADDAGIGELSLLAPALAQMAQVRRCTVWVLPAGASHDGTAAHEAHAVPYAPALAAAGVDLARTIFVRPATPRENLWAIEQALRARHLGAVVGWLSRGSGAEGDFRALRRLHLLAQRHQALAFVLRSTRHTQAPSPAALRLQLANDGTHLAVTLLKRRGRPLLEPVTLALRPPHWEAQVAFEHAAPNVQPASSAALFSVRPLHALLNQ